MDASSILKEQACNASLSGTTKKECLLELARLIIAAAPTLRLAEVLDALEERESKGSTAFEGRIALPHARLETSAFAMGIGISSRGVDFESPDGKRTHIFFVLAGPLDRPQEYLRLLAQISRAAENPGCRRDLLRATTPLALKEAFLQHIDAAPTARSAGEPPRSQKLLVIVLYELQHLGDIGELLLEHGIRGATVTDSTGMGNVLSRAPRYATFLDFLGERKKTSKTIMTTVEASQVQPLVAGIEAILGDLNTHSGAAVFALDLVFLKGALEIG